MIKRIQINDANDVRNARDHMKKIRDGISSGCITVSFDFRNDNSANLMLFASAEDTEVKCNAYATGSSEAGFLVPVTPRLRNHLLRQAGGREQVLRRKLCHLINKILLRFTKFGFANRKK